MPNLLKLAQCLRKLKVENHPQRMNVGDNKKYITSSFLKHFFNLDKLYFIKFNKTGKNSDKDN